MPAIYVGIIKWITDDPQPGGVACQLTNAYGTQHVFIGKQVYFTWVNFNQDSPYPQLGEIACTIIDQQCDPNGRQIIIVDTKRPWDIASTNHEAQFAVLAEQLSE